MTFLPPPVVNRIWLKWKSMKLPWRKRWLAGSDLNGNTFWYFKPIISSANARRILQYNPMVPYSDIQISPQWHQWLRYTRAAPPTISEQQADALRQRELKDLVQLADARWAAKPSLLDKPRPRKGELGISNGQIKGTPKTPLHLWGNSNKDVEGVGPREKQMESPWKLQKEHFGRTWQPEAWSPEPLKK